MSRFSEKCQIKVVLPTSEHDLVRVAAALRRMPMAEFCRVAVVAAASQTTKGLALPAEGKSENRKSH